MRRQVTRLGLNSRPGMVRKAPILTRSTDNRLRPQLIKVKRRLYRAMWLCIQRTCPVMGRAEVAKRHAAVKTFLYRHDRRWLVRHQPVALKRMVWAPLVNWGARDERLVSAICRCVRRLRNHVGKPRRITRHVIWKSLKDERWYLSPLIPSEKLPKTLECLRGVVETKEKFAIRRVQWAKESFIRSRAVPTRSAFMRRVGLNVETRRVQTVSAQIHSALNDLGVGVSQVAQRCKR
jgi:Tn7-like transposition protein D